MANKACETVHKLAIENTPLQRAIAKGREQGKLALYFGCWDRAGHYLHRPFELVSDDRKRAWATRRAKYGVHGHG